MNKKKGNTNRILAILCAVTMVVTLFPAGLWSSNVYATDEETPAAAEVQTPEKQQPADQPTEEAGASQEKEAPSADTTQPEEEVKTVPEEEPVQPEAATTQKADTAKENAAPAKEETKDGKQDKEAEPKGESKNDADKKAVEEEEIYRVEFDLTDNYANFNPISEKTTKAGGKFTLPEKPEARKELYKSKDGEEYYFTGWEYKGHEYEPGDTLTLKADAKFKAVWKQTYAIGFSTKGITADEIEDQTEVYGEPVTLPDETASKDGYDFVGWTPDNGKTVYAPGKVIASSSIQPKRSVARLRLTGVTADTSKPDVYIQYQEKKSDANCVTFKVIAEDKGSGIDKVEVKIPGHPELNDWGVVSEGFTADVQDGVTIYARATDKEGNESGEKSKLADLSKDYDTSEPNIAITKVDGVDGDDEAAVAKQEHTIDFSVDKEGCSLRAFVDSKEITDSISGDFDSGYSLTVSGDDLESTETVSIIAVDAEDNYKKAELVCSFDITAPVVSVKLTGTPETPNYYNAENGTISIEIEDADNDLASVDAKINGTSVGTEVAADGKSWTLSGKITELTGNDQIESKITVDITAKDAAGNEVKQYGTVLDKDGNEGEFYIDTIAPKLTGAITSPTSISTDSDVFFYDANAVTNYTVTETYPSELKLEYVDSNGETRTVESTDGKTVKGEWTAEDDAVAEYSGFVLFGEDLAGNKLVAATDYNSTEDTIDTSQSTEGKIAFNVTKIIDLKAPQAVVTYTVAETPYLYKEGENITAYTKGTVTAKIETILDEESNETFSDLDLEYKIGNGTAVAITEPEITVNLGTDEGTYNLSVGGTDRTAHKLKVVEKMAESPAVAGPAANKVPTTEKRYGKGEGPLQLTFIIDKTAPVYTSSFTVPSGTNGETAYYTGDVTASVTYEDDHLDTNLMKMGVITGTGTDELYSAAQFNWSDPTEKASGSGTTATAEQTASGDGAYRFTVTGKDKAGNTLVMSAAEVAKTDHTKTTEVESKGFWSMTKIIDSVSPQATLTADDYYKLVIKGIKGVEEKSVEKYEPFRKETKATISIETDDKSPVSISYKIRYNKKSDSTTEGAWVHKVTYGSDSDFADKKNASTTLNEGEIQFEVFEVKVVDCAGNETSLGDTNIIFLDVTAPDVSRDVVKPQPKITATTAVTKRGPKGQNLYNNSVELKFTVADPNKYKSSSGLKTVKYAIYVDGKKVDDVTLKDWKPLEGKPAVGTNPTLVYTYTKNITLAKGGKYESNRINVVLEAEDNAGNKDDASILFGIDSIGPKIVVSYDNNSAQNEKYFKANRTATITVEERNLGTGSDKIKINTEVGVPGKWSYNAGGAKSGNNDKWIKKCSYTKDGDYTMSVSGTDALGNPASVSYTGTAPREFTIDKTTPVIKVTFNNNNVRNRKYYKANRTATIRIDEHNFRDSDVKVNGAATKPRGGGMGFPARGKFSSNGDIRRATIPFTKEGAFKFDVNYTDLAGNKAKVVTIDEFVIDKTNPTVKIENVINGGIYGGTVAPRAVFDDDTFSRDDSVFRFTGVRKVDRNELVPGFHSNGEYGGSYTMSDFPYYKINDDIYTAYASSTDLAGNTTTVSVTFSVNRFGSTFDYNKDKTTENLVSKESGRYYTNVAEDLQIREINVNHIKNYSLTLDRGGNTVKLKEGKDYTVVKSESDMGTTYIYKISKSIVTDEGNYNIVVKSEDDAGNVNTNAAIRSEGEDSEVPLRFVYDVTDPTMSFLDEANNNNVIELKVDDKNSFRNLNELLLGIIPEDDWALGAIQFVLSNRNGVISDSGVINGKEFWDVMGEDGIKHFVQKIGNGTDVKTLTVTVWDAAGNDYTQDYKIIVTKNIGQLALANWYWILLLLGLAAGGYGYYRYRRDDDDDDDDDDEDDAA